MKRCIFFIFLLFYFSVQSQDYPREKIDLDLHVDNLFQLQDEGVNYEQLYENLVNYYQNPINLNKTNYEELSTLLVLSDRQIKNLLNHIDKNGKLLTIYELQAIDGFDLNTIHSMLPFMAVRNVSMNIDAGPLWKRIVTEDNNSIIWRMERVLEDQRGYNPEPKDDGTLPSHYLGGPWKQYIRQRVSHKNDFSIGFLAEKDKGEQFVWDPNTKRYGFDFYSFHFHTYNKGKFKKVAFGDYQLQDAQSLIFAGGFLIGKSPETVNSARRTSVGIRPYTSAIEGGFFRGAAATYQINKRIDVTFMGSRLRVNARDIARSDSVIDVGDFNISFSSLNTGNHRTSTEISRKHNATKYDVGSILKYTSKDKKLQLGLSALETIFSDSVKNTGSITNQYRFEGKRNLIYGANYTYNWQNFNFFGEVAQSQSGGVGFVNGVIGSLSDKLQVALHLRSFDRNFHSLQGDPFSESGAINERGMYYGMKYKFNPKWELSAYYDKFMFPWLRFQVDQTNSFGDEYLGRLQYKPKRSVTMYFQHKNETKLRNLADNETRIDIPVPTTRQTQIFNIDINASSKISLKSRVQWSYFQQDILDKEVGYMILQDLNFKFKNLRFSTRYAIFDTEGSNNRQYTYEKDVLYAYSIFSFSGTGVRKYVLVRYTLFRKIDIWAKIMRTTYNFTPSHTIGSGLEQIEGNKRTDFRIQMRYKF